MRALKASLINDMASIRKKAGRYMVTTALTASGVLALTAPSFADNWTDHTGTGISVDTSVPNTTNITQTLDMVKVRGDGDINAGWTVNVAQPNAKSKYVLYDVENDPTYILGTLNANGQIYIFDQNGVIFGKDSVVNVGGIIASTGYISDANLQADKLVFENVGTDGQIILNGTVNIAQAGLAAFVAPTAINNGIINAKLGTVAFAAGNKVTLDLYGDNLVSIAVDDKLQNALIENKGTINAEGGTVALSAQAAASAVDNVINLDGVVDVSSVSVKGGKIILGGGNQGVVKVSGKANASGTDGGSIQVTGQNVDITSTAELTADAGQNGDGGSMYVYGNQYAIFSGRASARGGAISGNGGDAEISGGDSVGYYGFTDLSAANGSTGTLLIDPRILNITNGLPSGLIADAISGGNSVVSINAQALAQTLRSSNVNLWATETINTAVAGIDLSTWYSVIPLSSGITTNDLTLAAPTINIRGDIILGTGDLNIFDLAGGTVTPAGLLNVPAGGIDVDVVNLNGEILTRSTVGGTTTLAGDNQLGSQANTVNVQSNNAKIQQGIWLAKDAGATVNVATGTYQEQVVIDKSLSLIGTNATITSPTNLVQTGYSPQGAKNYGIVYVKNADDVNISGFTIDGSTNAQISAFDNVRRFVGVIYQKSSGVFEDNTILNIKSAATDKRSGFGFLATDDSDAGSTLSILNNTITNFQKYGIALADAGLGVTVQGNTINGSKATTTAEQTGIYITDGADAIVTANTINNTDIGIGVNASSGGQYTSNILDLVHNGFVINKSANSVLTDNEIAGNSTIGISVIASNGTTVTGGNVHNFDTGIKVTDSDDVTITGVDIYDILTANGIDAFNSDRITISDNNIGTLGDVVGDGIFLKDSNDFAITGNDISNTKTTATNIGSGIQILDSHGTAGVGGAADVNALIQGNTISNTQWDGIRIQGGHRITADDNTIDNVARSGIYAEATSVIALTGNDIDTTGRNGIRAGSVKGLLIDGNLIGLDGGAGNIGFANVTESGVVQANGIRIEKGTKTIITDNQIANTVANGISVLSNNNIIIGNAAGVDGNVINTTGHDAISLLTSNFATINGNEIGLTGGVENINGDGIHLQSSTNATINGNTIANTRSRVLDNGSGIQLLVSSDATINSNTISDTGWDGIRLQSSDRVTANANIIDRTTRSGIYSQSGKNLTLTNNDLDTTGRNGIRVGSGNDALIQGNLIGLDGPAGSIGTENFTDIDGVVQANGIRIEKGNNTQILGNQIANVVQDGISVGNTGKTPINITIASNTLTNDGSGIGILLSGGAIGAATVSLNSVTDFDTAMAFESGAINLLGGRNTLTGGRVGMLFSRFGGTANLTLAEDDAAGTSTPFVAGDVPTDYAGTIGAQTFSGQSESYIELENFAFWDDVNGVPFWINGLNSTYDLITPSDTGGALSQADYDTLEGGLRHFPDGIQDGIFFFGTAPDALADIDESQLFREFAGFNGDITGLNIRILGLPRTGFGGGGLAAANLNNIVPFAGGNTPANLNNIETAAGGTAVNNTPTQSAATGQDLNAIETEAGGQNTGCWGDALNVAGNGQAVNVVYSGSFADTLTTAATCSTGAL